MTTPRLRFALASLGLAAALAACGTTTTGGKNEESSDDAVLAVNLETGERQTFPSEDDVPDGWGLCEGDVCPEPLGCTSLEEASCLSRTDCAPLYDASGTFGGCTEGGATCDPAECGPAPGMPSIECPDGSIGGSTGRCTAEGGSCGWEIRQCPDPTCDEEACGPAPGMPAYLCDDGSVGGNTGLCLANLDGTCGWEIRVCPTDPACAADACGSPPPSAVCADGSGTVGDCTQNAEGVCAWETHECPETLCDEAECGPQPGMPSKICEDGSVGGSTGRCILYDGEMCGWEILECPEDAG